MITLDNFKELLIIKGYILVDENKGIYSKEFPSSGCKMTVNFKEKRLIYPDEIEIVRETTLDFSKKENFVEFECIDSLLSIGYKPSHIVLEKGMPGGHDDTGGYCDIIVKDNNGKEYLLIECKTTGTEKESDDAFLKEWKIMNNKGGQLFNYFNSFRRAKYLCLYASDIIDGEITPFYYVVSMVDNREYLATNKKLVGYEDVKAKGEGRDEFFNVWKYTYGQDYETRGVFEANCEPFKIGKSKRNINSLHKVKDDKTIQEKYNQFASILRKYNVSGRENAFDKLVNLFLVKIVDETRNSDDLQFQWKGAAYDDFFSFQDRLEKMYKVGMKEFLDENVTYIDNAEIEKAFKLQKNDPDAIKETIIDYFRQLKFYSNNNFAFLDVHNEQLFYQNAVILKEMVKMLQDMRLKSKQQNQFLGDLFEGFLDQGVKQSEGQFFTPLPIVRFMVSSLPLERIFKDTIEMPKVLDYACGAGHFLNEYAHQIKDYVSKYRSNDIVDYYTQIYGIEKEYRLSKVSKVSSFMYGQDGIQIFYGDALTNLPQIEKDTFSIIIANPPYSVKGFLETLTIEQRQSYTLFSDKMDIKKLDNIEIFFVERTKQLLKPGGLAAIILPVAVLSNVGVFVKCRELIMKYFDIISIVELGKGTFSATKSTTTVSLFLRKKEEDPSISDHYKYRVESWFSGDYSKDERYEDRDLLIDYCNHNGYDYSEYLSLLEAKPSYKLLASETFDDYKERFESEKEYKDLVEIARKKNWSPEDLEKEKDDYILKKTVEIEKEKLYYYLIAKSNPQPVIVVKSPGKSSEIKKFLGYEWSGTKGKEGIKYIGYAYDEENGLKNKKGIEYIETPLFDPQNLNNPNKINTYIRNQFVNPTKIEDKEKFVSTIDLVDMIDFSMNTFDKSINVSGIKGLDIQSDYPLIRLKNIALLLQRGKSPIYGDSNVQVIKSGQAKGGKKFDFSEKYYVSDRFSFDERKLQKGDILINSTGVGTAGRVTLFDLNGDFVADNHITILRVKKDINYLYVYYLLAFAIGYDQMSKLAKGSSGQVEISKNTINNTRIPIPEDIKKQNKIVSECKIIEEEYNKIRMSDESFAKKILNVFVKNDILKLKKDSL